MTPAKAPTDWPGRYGHKPPLVVESVDGYARSMAQISYCSTILPDATDSCGMLARARVGAVVPFTSGLGCGPLTPATSACPGPSFTFPTSSFASCPTAVAIASAIEEKKAAPLSRWTTSPTTLPHRDFKTVIRILIFWQNLWATFDSASTRPRTFKFNGPITFPCPNEAANRNQALRSRIPAVAIQKAVKAEGMGLIRDLIQ